MESAIQVPSLQQLLDSSAATPEFRAAALKFAQDQQPSDRIQFSARGNPPVKVLRALCGLLEHVPALAIDRVAVSGESGCSDYRGEIVANGTAKFRFVWDCRWRAEQEGWTDCFGDPDQQKAARAFGYRCFQKFDPA